MAKNPGDSVWMVHANSRQYSVYAGKRDAEAAAFEIALEQSVDGEITIDDDPNNDLTHFVFAPKSGEQGWVYVAEEPLY